MAKSNSIGSYNFAEAITKSDTVNILIPDQRLPQVCDAIYVGGAGDINVVLENGTAVVFAGTLAGTIIPVAAKRVNSASTTATSLLALFNL